jgi:hypothetical protein
MQLTWAICDELGGVRDWITERQNASVDLGVNKERTGTVTASIEDEAVQTVRPGKSRLKVYCHPEAGDPASFLLLNGLIMQPKVDGTRVELPAVDPAGGRLPNASPAPYPVKSAAIDPFWQIEELEQSQWMSFIIARSDSRAHVLNLAEPDRPPVPRMGIVDGTLADSGIYLIRKPGDTQTTWDELVARSQMDRAPDFEFEPLDNDAARTSSLSTATTSATSRGSPRARRCATGSSMWGSARAAGPRSGWPRIITRCANMGSTRAPSPRPTPAT